MCSLYTYVLYVVDLFYTHTYAGATADVRGTFSQTAEMYARGGWQERMYIHAKKKERMYMHACTAWDDKASYDRGPG